MDSAPTLTDGTVILRAHRADDAQGCLEQCQDPVSREWTTVPVPYSIDDARTFVTEVMPGGWADGSSWGFAVEVDGRYAGTVEVRDEGEGRMEVAYGSHPWVRGTGAFTRAVRLLVDWGFADRGARVLVWRANRGNWASRKLAWRLGFTLEGTIRSALPQRGELRDAWVGTLLPDDVREPTGVWLATPELTDGVVRLRALRDSDLARVVEAAGDDRTARWLGRMPSPYTEEDAHTWLQQTIESAATGDAVTWAVTAADDDVLLATVNLFDVTVGGIAEVGFWAHPGARGRGVATRATALALRHGFETLELVQVQGHAALGNTASRHALEAGGLREAGVVRLGTFIRPEGRVDAMRYDVLVEEWREAQPRARAGF